VPELNPNRSYTLAETLERQVYSASSAGSPMYASLLNGLLADYLSGGFTSEILDGVSATPLHDATPLRYLAVGHRLALEGRAPGLAALYPSCGGRWDGRDITDVFLSTVACNRGEFVRGVQRGVQTNEVGRAPVLASAFALLAHRHRSKPLDVLEIGSSAGLLSQWDRYFYDTGETQLGDSRSRLQFGPQWWKGPKPALDVDVSVRRKRAVDLAPIDVSTEEGRIRMLSFVWPDQPERIERLRAALEIAAHHPLVIERGDAGAWLGDQLREGPMRGAITVVFHSIVWQYLPRASKDGVRAALAHAGAMASVDAPLAWVRMEPSTPDHAEVRLTTWPTGEQELLAQVGYHGADIRWVASA
jgi:hypothetical protein